MRNNDDSTSGSIENAFCWTCLAPRSLGTRYIVIIMSIQTPPNSWHGRGPASTMMGYEVSTLPCIYPLCSLECPKDRTERPRTLLLGTHCFWRR